MSLLNKDEPAFATANDHYHQEGLTKREYISTHILASIIAGRAGYSSPKENVERALEYTDELLKQIQRS